MMRASKLYVVGTLRFKSKKISATFKIIRKKNKEKHEFLCITSVYWIN